MGKPKKRVNPKVTSRINQNIKELSLKTAVKFMRKMPPPYEVKRRGRKPHDPKVVTLLCLHMVSLNLTLDDMMSEMRDPRIKQLLDVEKLPSRSALHRGMQKLSQKYIRKFNNYIVRRFLKRGFTIVVDSTGFRLKTSSAWYDIRIKRKNMKKDNSKLHIAIEVRRNAIVNFKITSHKRNDSPQLEFLLRNLKFFRRVIGDSAYLSRQNCDIVVEKNGKPFFKLKSNTTGKAKGSTAWKKMVRFANECKKAFDKIYHLRSKVEGVISSLKRRYGSTLRPMKRRTRNVVLSLKVVAYNIKQLLYDKTAKQLRVPFWIKC